jgi:hypothetical protein
VAGVFFYCFSALPLASEITTGQTGNAAATALQWTMDSILPPQAGLSVNGLIYQYTITKDPTTDSWVTIQNENANGDGVVLSHTDDWSGLPGNTLNKFLTFGDIPTLSMGDGSIFVTGDGTLSDVNVGYNFKFDSCVVPLSDPNCPGFRDALYKWLMENGLINTNVDINDPYYDQYVKELLNRQANTSEDEPQDNKDEEEKEDKDSLEAKLSVKNDANMKIAEAAKQNAMLEALRVTPTEFNAYLTASIQGGVYEESVILQDATLPDNADVMRNLAKEDLHQTMVRSQYNLKP